MKLLNVHSLYGPSRRAVHKRIDSVTGEPSMRVWIALALDEPVPVDGGERYSDVKRAVKQEIEAQTGIERGPFRV